MLKTFEDFWRLLRDIWSPDHRGQSQLLRVILEKNMFLYSIFPVLRFLQTSVFLKMVSASPSSFRISKKHIGILRSRIQAILGSWVLGICFLLECQKWNEVTCNLSPIYSINQPQDLNCHLQLTLRLIMAAPHQVALHLTCWPLVNLAVNFDSHTPGGAPSYLPAAC